MGAGHVGSASSALGYSAVNEAKIASPADTFLAWDCDVSKIHYDNQQVYEPMTRHHNLRPGASFNNPSLNGSLSPHSAGENYLYCDGHVKWLPRQSVPDTDVRFTGH